MLTGVQFGIEFEAKFRTVRLTAFQNRPFAIRSAKKYRIRRGDGFDDGGSSVRQIKKQKEQRNEPTPKTESQKIERRHFHNASFIIGSMTRKMRAASL